ncbi:MAG: response regulator [Candidatus Tectomicrobia bacterium]|uniref:histidine kinase n=1 Tax=Tectimicrobiota bacterium TaxID=2528274 RepID=A0A932CLD7_UNCTE|nr:response regulator [Candidatus Tectomicrobia bacterium]
MDRDDLLGVLYCERDMEEITEHKWDDEVLLQQSMQISLLNQITRAVIERQDLGSIFRIVLGRLEDHLPIDAGVILLFDPQTDTATVAVCGPKGQTLATELDISEGTNIPIEQTILRLCIHGETVYASDIAQVDEPILRRFSAQGIRSVIFIPLVIEGETFGILSVLRREANGFNIAERDFLQALGEHVSLAAHQARLHQDLHRAYDELQKTQQMVMQQERLRALGQMASGIAHDINNTLSPIVGFSSLLLMSEPNLSERARRYLEDIQTAGTDISHIVSRMREFYRQREEREPLWPVQLNQLVYQVIQLTRPRWKDIPQERGTVVEIQTELQQELPCVMGIESEIREALINLILNSVDAMPDGGRITIHTRAGLGTPGSTQEETPPGVVLEVHDTGIGMDEETRQHCLEPFFSTKGERGTGLGLAMVYGVMQRHDGQIEIESAPGQGTMVRLIFPLPQASGGPMDLIPQKEKQRSPVASLRVLCIDDEPVLRELLKEMLQEEGYRVEVADGGQAGLDAFFAAREQGEPFDVVVTDLGMPYVDGREVVQTVKRESPTTPVILLTGWDTPMTAEGDIPAQVDAVLIKPPKAKALQEVLAQVTQTSRLQQSPP